MVLVFLFAQIDMEHAASIWHLFHNNGVSISCAGVVIIRVWAAYIRVWAAIIRVRAAYTPRMLGAVDICNAHLPRTYCVMYARRSHSNFFENVQNFMAHVAHVAYAWRTWATPLRTFGEPTA